VLPPRKFVAALVELAMVRAAQGHREFVAYFAAQRALLGELKVVRIRRTATAGEARLSTDKFQMIPVS
jgi:hypothetical protein